METCAWLSYSDDFIINKTSCYSFYNTDLKSLLDRKRINRVIVIGCAAEYCVDSTVRAELSHDLNIIFAADGHTASGKPHVEAATLINRHNRLWHNLIHPEVKIEFMKTTDLIL